MSKRFLIILVIIAVGFFGLLFLNKKDAESPDQNGEVQLTEHVYGNPESSVRLVEYGDFECSACGSYFPILQQIKEQYKDKIGFQFRHYPLVESHQNALVSSRAAEAAANQGKFWEMHDLLFGNQQSWAGQTNPTPMFESYAESLQLDMDKFREDMKSPETNKIVQADRSEARRKGYTGTPTFELNGERIQSPGSLEEFTKLIDEALQKQP